MELKREWLETLIFRGEASRRFTQDSPVLPDVWIALGQAFSKDPAARIDLLLTPHRTASAAELASVLRARLQEERGPSNVQMDLAYNQSTVAVSMSFPEVIRILLPLSKWWQDAVPSTTGNLGAYLRRQKRRVIDHLRRIAIDPEQPPQLQERVNETQKRRGITRSTGVISPAILWMIRVVGVILIASRLDDPADDAAGQQTFLALGRNYDEIVDAVAELLSGVRPPKVKPLLWTVSQNRKVKPTISRSVMAVKADAARRVFEIDCKNICWAIVDSGIDARHPAFRQYNLKTKEPYPRPFPQKAGNPRPENNTRIAGTFDFTRIRKLLNPEMREQDRVEVAPATQVARQRRGTPKGSAAVAKTEMDSSETLARTAADLTDRLQNGKAIDWDELLPLLEVPQTDMDYAIPFYDHGTHVAGILAANWRKDTGIDFPSDEEADLVGVCPDLCLYDFRVLNDQGEGDEFTVMAALQFIRHLNSHRDEPVIHGANLSFSLKHDVANYACGRTPVCDECERVVSSGVVVVAAAGNDGYLKFTTPGGEAEGYQTMSISDPGNGEAVITVGATHRYQPHTYGVSYFSSRGPTGDGRYKPDLVAPGEKITAPLPDSGVGVKDGTSMAAPHVSGAAALLMARHRELLGQPARVKEILCETATDLGRERYFQGHGMLDILRALQSV
jgi:subtilisin family serine protease